jgi:hypothetical protein
MESTLEQVRAWAVWLSFDVGYSSLRRSVINFNTLYGQLNRILAKLDVWTLTRSLAHAIRLPLHRMCQIGPSPRCNAVPLCPSQPFSCIVRVPAMPPHTTARDPLFAKFGSRAKLLNGRFMSKTYDSEPEMEWMNTCPGLNH